MGNKSKLKILKRSMKGENNKMKIMIMIINYPITDMILYITNKNMISLTK